MVCLVCVFEGMCGHSDSRDCASQSSTIISLCQAQW